MCKNLRVNAVDPCSESVVAHIITLLESVNTSAGIYELLLACEERMAVGADINTKVVAR